jgi:hypothetical protein
MKTSWLATALSLAACGGGGSAKGPDADVGGDATGADAPDAQTGFVEAPHDNAPQDVKLNGPVMASVTIVPIFFSGDGTMQTQVELFLNALAASSYWAATTREYGVGALTIHSTIVSTDTPPTTDDALKTWLATQTDGTHVGWPLPDGNTLYAVFLPAGVSLSTPFGNSCTDFRVSQRGHERRDQDDLCADAALQPRPGFADHRDQPRIRRGRDRSVSVHERRVAERRRSALHLGVDAGRRAR